MRKKRNVIKAAMKSLWLLTLQAIPILAYTHQESLKNYLKEQDSDLMKTRIIDDLVIGKMGLYLQVNELE